MSVVLVTGSAGLIGSETVRFFCDKGFDVVGLDNDMRRYFFGDEASTDWNREQLERSCARYTHAAVDVRDLDGLTEIFQRYGKAVSAIIHTAAQPSHDWAAREPFTDFGVNATGTLNLLDLTRRICPDAPFVFTSTNKVYGDTPNRLPLVERETRWEVDPSHPFAAHGIDESMSIDQSTHSLFGVSKLAADALVQEYGRYFGLKTACFRGGCLTGPSHSGAQLHGFLAYLVKCAVTGTPYTVLGYQGKQVRDNIHAHDLVEAFWRFVQAPRCGEVYNMGGGRHSNCSMREAIAMVEALTGRPMTWSYREENRIGDHVWYISDTRRFQTQYPGWMQKYTIETILSEIHAEAMARHAGQGRTS
ncbi:NAD-dependent epimerase/dehydratase family protein [Pararhodospirillum oryzae]|uniref:NAD-dependent epimerase n=1 Tax=Pararhodospirillum oryzae TaxID=478448 RepID=A0A512H8G2_9PROT|nr:NAD-dependent epimerase/dehydratase family protein [Pararhodospirillum oryzae]GEO81743.1 NAD-dependent epimerase [Pararhodospirillum oryzae]